MNMYHMIFKFLLCLVPYTFVFSYDDQQLSEQANMLFTHAEYQKALDIYTKIEHKTFPVLFNMSLSYLNQADCAKALLYAKRAEKKANYNELTLLYEFIACIRKEIDPEYQASWLESITIFSKKCIRSIPMLLLQILFLWALLFLFFTCWYRSLRLQAILLNIWYCLVFGILLSYKVSLLQEKTAVIMKKNVPVYAGPDSSFYTKTAVPEAHEVMIKNQQNNYYQIQVHGVCGWVNHDDIELV